MDLCEQVVVTRELTLFHCALISRARLEFIHCDSRLVVAVVVAIELPLAICLNGCRESGGEVME